MKNKLCKWMFGVCFVASMLGISIPAEAYWGGGRCCPTYRPVYRCCPKVVYKKCCHYRPVVVYKRCCYRPVVRPCCGYGYGGYGRGYGYGWGGGWGLGLGYYRY